MSRQSNRVTRKSVFGYDRVTYKPSADPYLEIRIMLTHSCNVDPHEPHFYIQKTRIYMGIHLFLTFALKYRLFVLSEAVLKCTYNDPCLEQK